MSFSGYIEMLARQMTTELQAIRDTIEPGESRALLTKVGIPEKEGAYPSHLSGGLRLTVTPAEGGRASSFSRTTSGSTTPNGVARSRCRR